MCSLSTARPQHCRRQVCRVMTTFSTIKTISLKLSGLKVHNPHVKNSSQVVVLIGMYVICIDYHRLSVSAADSQNVSDDSDGPHVT